MNNFFTRKWYKYVCKEMSYALPKTYYLCCVNEKNFFDKLITDDVEYDLDKIIIDKFKEYFNRKKKYVDSYLKLEKEFGIYEKLEELGSYDEELEKYKNKLVNFANNTKNKLDLVIDKLKKNDIIVENNLSNEDFILLGLNILKVNVLEKYREIKYIDKKDNNLLNEELENIDYIYNDVDAFLTDEYKYLSKREDKFSGEFENVLYHESHVINFEKNNNDVILDIIDLSETVYRFKFSNVLINKDIVNEQAYDLSNVKKLVESTWVEIEGIDYGNYEDYSYYLKLFLCYVPEKKYNLKKSDVVVSFIADKITVEVISRPLVIKYCRNYGLKLDNFEKYKKILSENVINFFLSYVLGRYVCKNIECINNDIIISYENITKENSNLNVKFLDVLFNNNKNKILDEISLIKKNSLDANYIRIIDYNDNSYEIGLLLSFDREVVISCSDILCDRDIELY